MCLSVFKISVLEKQEEAKLTRMRFKHEAFGFAVASGFDFDKLS